MPKYLHIHYETHRTGCCWNLGGLISLGNERRYGWRRGSTCSLEDGFAGGMPRARRPW